MGENQTRNWLPITTGWVRSDSKKWSIDSVETDELQRQAKENEPSSDLVGGERNVTDRSLHVTDLSDFLKNIARSEPKWSYLSRSKQNCCWCKWKMANHHRIWTKEAFIWSGGQAGWVATVLKEKTCHSTRQNRVWRVETRRRPPKLLGRAANRPVRVGFSVWSV